MNGKKMRGWSVVQYRLDPGIGELPLAEACGLREQLIASKTLTLFFDGVPVTKRIPEHEHMIKRDNMFWEMYMNALFKHDPRAWCKLED